MLLACRAELILHPCGQWAQLLCWGGKHFAVVDAGGVDLGNGCMPYPSCIFCFFSMKNVLRKGKEQAVHGWTAGKASSFSVMSLLPLPSSPPASTELWGRIAWNPMGSVGSWVPSAPDPSHLLLQGNSDEAERNAFQTVCQSSGGSQNHKATVPLVSTWQLFQHLCNRKANKTLETKTLMIQKMTMCMSHITGVARRKENQCKTLLYTRNIATWSFPFNCMQC